MIRKYFNRFTSSGGVGILIGLGVWITQGGLDRPVPTPIWYWVGVGIMVIGTVVFGRGCIYGDKLVKEEKEKVLDDIKESLVNMSAIERDTATKMSLEMEIDKETVRKVFKDCEKVLEDCLSKLDGIPTKEEWNALAKYCDAVGRVLDMHKVGLKIALNSNDMYKACKVELEQKRLHLKKVKKNKLIQSNIFRVGDISYGVNSFIIVRGMLGKFPGYNEGMPFGARMRLEGIEDYGTAVVRVMVESLEDDWSEEKRG